MGSLAWVRPEGVSAARLVVPWTSARAADAELVVAVPEGEAIAIGAFQRPADAGATGLPVLRRASGGAALRVGPGTVFVQLALARVDALAASAPDQLLNRYVRPLLAAITKTTGKPARYFGRDWVAVGGRPVAAVAFGHDAGAGSAVFEAVVSVTEAVFVDASRGTFRGKEPATLDSDPARVADAIAEAYRSIAETARQMPFDREMAPPVDRDEPWQASRDEAIGRVAAGRDARGVLRIGGELMASRDAVTRLEERIATEPSRDVEALVFETLDAPGVVTFGVRSLLSIRDVILAARQG